MPKKDQRIDSYIAEAGAFARPVLRHFRKLVHEVCPTVEETIKWGMPHFDYKERVLCGMAAFKQHCALNFWESELIFDKGEAKEGAMGDFGRITGMSDLPPDEQLRGYIEKAVEIRDKGVRAPKKTKPAKRGQLRIPPQLKDALRSNRRAGAAFAKLSYSHRKEYANWIAEAKRNETREKRVATALEWLAEGKPRNWKNVGR